MSEQATYDTFRDALAAHLADLGHDGAVIIGYSAVVELVTPGETSPWLKTLCDQDSAPWTRIGRIEALRRTAIEDLRDGWTGDDE